MAEAKDPYFRVEVLNQSLDPQQLIYAAMHTDYSEEFVFDELKWMSNYSTASYYNQVGITEEKAGELVVKYLLAGGRGHYGPLEHPQIVFNVGFFPHSTMQQVRTHRVGVSFDCQSFRYTGSRILEVAEGKRDVDEVFYLRPVGSYTDREGKRYEYSEFDRECDRKWCIEGARKYAHKILNRGASEEHARGLIPFDVRQNWVMSCNVRSLMHLLDMRGPANAQLECQWLCELILPHFQEWVPQVSEWYMKNRWKKPRLAP